MAKRSRGGAGANSTQSDIFIAMAEGEPVVIPASSKFAAVAEDWNGRLASRKNWAGRSAGKARQAQHAFETLRDRFSINADELARIARSGAVEVSFPEKDFYGLENAMQVPWEYLLYAGTKNLRPKNSALRVTRRLRCGDRAMGPPNDFLFIENVPRELAALAYTFDEERIKAADGLGFGAGSPTAARSDDESKDAVLRRFAAGHSVIHFSGFDVFQIQRYLRAKDRKRPAGPGLAVRTGEGHFTALSSRELSGAIGAQGEPRTSLLCFNCHNTGGLLAAESLASGLAAAAGILGSVEDEVMEYFYGAFYAALRASAWNVHAAFDGALAAMRQQNFRLHGSCIVLWTASSAFAPFSAEYTAEELRQTAVEDEMQLWQQIHVAVKPYTEINYSLLHNEQPLFQAFEIRRRFGCKRLPLEITVELGSGADSLPYRKSDAIERLPLSYRTDVKLPLISTLTRSLRERLHSSLYVRVRSGDTVLHESSTRVTILPVDEWSDGGKLSESRENDTRGVWLPSFVLPRDACVAKVIAAAQGYVSAIADDPDQGFDGYQSVEDEEAEGGRSAGVDAQVRAIWYALSLGYNVGYINPPPTYSKQTQRLRTPSDILLGGRGTCIDLTLLFAACFELIEIHPVIVLLTGHAFPGYWSSEGAYGRFLERVMNDDTPDEDAGQVPRNWVIGPAQLPIIRACVEDGELVVFDAVWLTQRAKFWEAIEEGVKWLQTPEKWDEAFECMIDVRLARTDEGSPVTPLPIL
jgi:hypothetical protein